MTNVGIKKLFEEDLEHNSYCKEIAERLQLIDKEIIRLIRAKKRYEQELEKLEAEQNNKLTPK